MTAQTGFHDGELAVQDRAGVRAQAARLGGAMLATPDLNGGMSAFLADRDFAVLTARDADGRLWTSPIFSSPGFLEARDRELRVHAVPGVGDPLHGIAAGQPLGMLAIEFATRRRVRVNGILTDVSDGRSAAGGRSGIRQLPQIHSSTPSRARRQPSAAWRTIVDAERRAPRAHHDLRHLLSRHHPSDSRRRCISSRRPTRIRPCRRGPAVVAGLPGQQHVQQLRQSRRGSERCPAVHRLRHGRHAACLGEGHRRMGDTR